MIDMDSSMHTFTGSLVYPYLYQQARFIYVEHSSFSKLTRGSDSKTVSFYYLKDNGIIVSCGRKLLYMLNSQCHLI